MDVLMLKNCTTSVLDTRKQPYMYEWSLLFFFFHKLLFRDIKLSDLGRSNRELSACDCTEHNKTPFSFQSSYLLITHQSHDHSDHLGKDLCNNFPPPSEIASFWTHPPPIPSEFLLPFKGGGGMDIFWKYTLHLWKGGKRVKILQAKQPSYKTESIQNTTTNLGVSPFRVLIGHWFSTLKFIHCL